MSLGHSSGIPGVGGVNRGRADAAMVWGDESPGRSDEFEARVLTPAELSDLEHSEILGVGATAPVAQPLPESGGALATESGLSKSAWRRRLAPRHREAVKGFFEAAGSSSPDGDH